MPGALEGRTDGLLGAMLSEWLTGAPGLDMLILGAGDMREAGLLRATVIPTVLA